MEAHIPIIDQMTTGHPEADMEAARLGAEAAAAVMAAGVQTVDQLAAHLGEPLAHDTGDAEPAEADDGALDGGPLGLYKYQLEHVERLLAVYERGYSCALDSSDTGTGKTRTSVEICRRLALRPFILCPKSVVPTWFNTCEMADIEPYGVANYETAKNGKHYESLEDFLGEYRVACPWVTPVKGRRVPVYRWSLNELPDCLLIIDEAHKGKNKLTACAALLRAARACTPTTRILMLSATISDKMETIHTLTYLLGFVQEGAHAFRRWAMMAAREANEAHLSVATVNRKIYPKFGSRMEAAQTGRGADGMNIFRNTDTRAEVYEVSPEVEAELAQRYAELNRALELIKLKQVTDDAPLVLLLRARQRIELLKVTTIIDQAAQLLVDGYSVVVFVNFRETLARIFERLSRLVFEEYRSSIVIIEGGQTPEERQEQIDTFQRDEARVALVMISAGGTGVSLHDIGGVYPRATLLMPPWSGVDLMQALGRVHRAGAQSDDRQRIVYISGALSKPEGGKNFADCTIGTETERIGVEEYIAKTLNRKLGVIEGINRGDTSEALVLRPTDQPLDELPAGQVQPLDQPPAEPQPHIEPPIADPRPPAAD